MKQISFALLILILLSACASVSPSSLHPASAAQSKTLSEDFIYEKYYSLAGNLMVHTLAAGEYVAKYEDDEGSYFEGPNKCFKVQVISDDVKKKGATPYLPHSYACGVYIPKSPTKDAKLYFYRDPEVSRAIFGSAQQSGGGVGIAEAIDAAELENLHFYQDQPQPGALRGKLR